MVIWRASPRLCLFVVINVLTVAQWLGSDPKIIALFELEIYIA